MKPKIRIDWRFARPPVTLLYIPKQHLLSNGEGVCWVARLNIEDRLWNDPRFLALSKVMGEELAIGHLIRFWRVSQNFWKQDEKPIPKNIYELYEFSPLLIKLQFARETDEGVYAKGAKRNFAWLVQRVNAGKNGGSAPKKPKPNKNEDLVKAEPKRVESETKAGASGTKASSLLSPSSSLLSLKTKEKEEKKEPSQAPVRKGKNLGHDFQEVLLTFMREYEKKYGVRYRTSGKERGLLAIMRKDLGGLGTYDRIVKAYFEMNDPFFINKRHDVVTLYSNMAKVSHYEQTGVYVSQSSVRGMEKQAERKEILQKMNQKAKERRDGKSERDVITDGRTIQSDDES